MGHGPQMLFDNASLVKAKTRHVEIEVATYSFHFTQKGLEVHNSVSVCGEDLLINLEKNRIICLIGSHSHNISEMCFYTGEMIAIGRDTVIIRIHDRIE